MADRKRSKNGQYAPNWFKNAAKSLGYAGIDLLKETMPVTFDTVQDNTDYVKELAKSLKKTNISKLGNIKGQLQGKALENYNSIEKIKSNAWSDLKSGKFYNNERKQSFADDFGLDDFGLDDDSFSFDLSDDLNDDNFDIPEDSDVKVVVPTVNVTANINKNNPMVKAVQQQSELIAHNEAAAYKRDVTLAGAQMKLDRDLANMLYGGMNTINDNLSNIINFNNEHFGGYIGASFKYYEESIGYLSEISESLKKIHGLAENQASDSYNDDNIFSSSGAFNLSAYTKLVKKQVSNMMDEDLLLGSIKSLFIEGEGLEMLAQAPLEFVPKYIMKNLVPEFVTNTMKSLDESFKAFLPALFNKMGSWVNNTDFSDTFGPLKSFLGSIFGIKNQGKTTIDTKNYEKGVVPFDGITRRSIVEVIPGYLSKILSALTGKDEIIFDSDEGIFLSKTDAKNKYESRLKNAALSEYDGLNEIKEGLAGLGYTGADYEKIKNHIDTLFYNLSKQGEFFNPNEFIDKDQISDLLVHEKIGGREVDDIRAAIKSLSKSKQMQLFGSGHMNARKAINDIIEEYERTGNALALSQANGLYSEDLDFRENNPLIRSFDAYLDSNSPNSTKVHNSIFTPNDRFGKNNLDYLRDIRSILLEGVNVFILKKGIKRNGSYDESANDISVNRYSINDRETTDAEKEANIEQGISLYDETFSLSTNQKIERIRAYNDKRNAKLTENQKKSNPLRKIFDFFFDPEKRKNIISDFFGGILDKTQNVMSNVFNKIDNSLYKLIFGTSDEDDGETNRNFFARVTNSIQDTFSKFHNYLKEKIFNPIKEALIGEEGLLTKFKQSEFYKGLKEKIGKAKDWLLGTKDGDGVYKGGLLSDVGNNLTSMMKSTKLYITGTLKDKDGKIIEKRDDSVFSEIKNIFTGFKNNMKEYIFGSNGENKEKVKGLLTDFGNYFKEGMQSFTDVIFGQHYDTKTKQTVSNITVNELTDKIKERAPKAIASGIVGGGVGLLAGAGGFGLLGSLFLGPMSGVVIGTATGFLSQSDKFKNWLFGEMGKDDKRTGGLISKSTQEFMKKHKSAIIGGTALGMLKGITGIGFLPSFILGGPVTGALFGLGASILTRSETFQNFLFGEKIDGKKRVGGLLSKIPGNKDIDGKDIARKAGFAGAGALLGAGTGAVLSSFGALGSLAFGPLSGAIIGGAAGIALAANKWKDAIFGKFDEKTGKKTENGILSKMMAAVTVEVLQPAKVQITEWRNNVLDWFEEKVAEPFLDSLDPIKEEISRLKNGIIDFAYGILDKLHIPDFFKTIGEEIKTGFSKLTSMLGKMIKGGVELIGKFTGFVLSSPFKLIHIVADKILLPKHMREGIRNVRRQILENIKESKFVQGVIHNIVEPVKNVLDTGKEYLFTGIKSIGSFTKDVILNTFRGIAQAAIGIITSPFKLGIGLVRGTVDLIKKLTNGGKRDTDRLSDITTGSGGKRGFMQSVGDLLSLANPFSSLRKAAKYSSADVNEIRERILNTAAQNGETLTDKELDKRVKKELREKTGAGYADEQKGASALRASKRASRKAARDEALKEMKKRLGENQQLARKKKYNLLTDEERAALSFEDFNKIIDNGIDKEYANQYGKEYKNQTKMQKDAFKESKENHNAIMSTEENTKGTKNILEKMFTEGIFIRKGKKTTKASTYNGEEKSEALKKDTQGDTVYERLEERKTEEEKEKKQSIFSRIAGWLKQGNDENKKHNIEWNKIFSKKGLITTGIMAALPFVISFFKDPAAKLGSLVGSFASAVGSLLGTLGGTIADKVKEALFGKNDKNGEPDARTNSAGKTQTNEYLAEDLAVGGAKVAITAGQIAKKTFTGIDNITGKVATAFHAISNKNTASEIAQAFGTTVDDVYKTLGKSAKYSYDDVAKAMGTSVDDVAGMLSKVKNPQSGVITKFIEFAKNAIDDFVKWISSTPLISKMAKSKGVTKIIGLINKVIGTPIKKLTSFMGLITKGTAVGAGKTTASVGTFGLTDVAFGLYGAVTGGTESESAYLFGVKGKDVDGTMRTVSALLKGILNTGWFFIISIVSEIGDSLFGVNLIREFAIVVYNFLTGIDGDTSEATKLKENQQKFKEDYKQYTLANQLALGNVELNENGEVKYDESGNIVLKDSSKVESFNSFNNRENKSVAGKAWSALTSTGKNISRFFVGNKGNSEKVNDYQNRLTQLEESAKNGLISDKSEYYIKTKQELEKSIKDNTASGNLFDKMASGYEAFENKTNEVIDSANAWLFDKRDKFFEASNKWLSDRGNDFKTFAANSEEYLTQKSIEFDKWVNDGIDEISDMFGKIFDFKRDDNVIKSTFDSAVNQLESFKNWFTGLFDFNKGDGVFKSISKSVNEKMSEFGEWFGNLFNKNSGGPLGIGGPIDMLNKYRVSSQYNESDSYGIRSGNRHKGIDLVSGENSPVYSFTDGRVVDVKRGYLPGSGYIGNTDGGGYGNRVFIEDRQGYQHRYAHLNAVGVRVGDIVSEGSLIGREGHTGNSTGAHLHYEVRKPNNIDINPVDYLKKYISKSVESNPSTGVDLDQTESTGESGQSGIMGLVSKISGSLSKVFEPLTNITSAVTDKFNKFLGISSSSSSTDTTSSDSGTVINDSSVDISKYNNKGLATGIIEGAKWIAKNYTSIGQNTLYKMRFNNGVHQYATDPNWANVIAGIMAGAPPHNGKRGLTDFLHQNLQKFEPISESELNNWIKSKRSDSPFVNNAKIFLDASKSSGLDPRYIVAHAATESGWGTSRLAKDKNNYFGIGAFDTSPYSSAYTFGKGGPIASDRKNLFTNAKRIKRNSIHDLVPAGGGNVEIDPKVYEYLSKIVDALHSIKDNTHTTSEKIEELKTVESEKNNNSSVVNVNNSKTNSPMFDIASNRRSDKINRGYKTAKLIAAGTQ